MKLNTPSIPRARLTVLVLAAVIALTATPAVALIPCELCEPNEPHTRCAGYCNGIPIWFCADWYFAGCGGWIAPVEMPAEELTEEQFIRSLQAAPAEEAPAAAPVSSALRLPTPAP